MRRRALALLPLATLGAWGATRPPPEAGSTPARPDLVALHRQVRVEGLEDRRFSPETWWEVVAPSLASPHLEVEEVGRSAEGRPLRHVSFGRGPVSVLMWSQMHGDESTASMALADVLAFLAGPGDHALRATLSERLTVHMVPVLNPDGAARFQRRNAQGIDVNRDARALATPEGKALKAVRDRVEPTFAFNLHDQNVGTRVGRTDLGVAIALLAPPPDSADAVTPVQARAMELIGVVLGAIRPLVGGHVARYDDTFNPRAFGDLMTAWGASTVLIESGGWEGDPQKQFLRQVNFVALLAALEAIATDGWKGVGRSAYEALEENGRSLPDLLVLGGTVAVPGLPPLRADLLVSYEDALLERGGTIGDLGDLADAQARDTLSAEGLWLVPFEEALDREGGGVQLQPGAPARFRAARDPEGRDVAWVFDGRPPGGR